MGLYEISNPEPLPSHNRPFTPACSWAPLCASDVCNPSLDVADRVAALIASMTLEEKVSNVIDSAAGSVRLGLQSYEWWSEALHGVGNSPAVLFQGVNGSNFSYATSFPMPILMVAAFDDQLIQQVGSVIGQEARAFANFGFAGFDFWTPNINPFRDPRWGRGAETPGEDPLRIQSYVSNLIPGLQGGNLASKQIIATCKHFAAYDIETSRTGNDLNPTQQDLGDYYLPSFKSCVRDAGAGSVMCSYTAVDGIPSCASEYLLQDVLRVAWNFTSPYNYIVADCDAVGNIYTPHNFTDTESAAAAVALNAGTDIDCGYTYLKLSDAIASNMTTEATLDRALTRLYNALFTVGYFDGTSPYNSLSWSDVSTPASQSLAYEAAVEGMTLLKNDGLLPLGKSFSSVAVIGPWANATTQMQGGYQGIAPFLNSPLYAFSSEWETVHYALGTNISDLYTVGFGDAIAAAKASDVVIYLGGIDQSIEGEGFDRTSIEWPGNQLDLIACLSQTGKPLVVVQFGGGQVDDGVLLENNSVNAIMWAGYPGQDGGYAVLDVLTGKKSVAGRLPVTQYPASYAGDVSIFDMNLRPSASSPGRTYKWYSGKPVVPFGYGLHYTSFLFAWDSIPKAVYDIGDIVNEAHGSFKDISLFFNVVASVRNAGGPANIASDYVGLLFISTTNAGPAPYPTKSLVSYNRLHGIPVNAAQKLVLPLTLASLARADENGDLTVYPGDYELILDIDAKLTANFSLRGQKTVIDKLPRQASSYNFTVPVHLQVPTMF
jgi:beta-D-xylosidase 4